MNINFWTRTYPIPGTYFLFCVKASDFLEKHGPVLLCFLHFKPEVVLVANLWQALKMFVTF